MSTLKDENSTKLKIALKMKIALGVGNNYSNGSLHFDANLSKTYWPYALNMATNLKICAFILL